MPCVFRMLFTDILFSKVRNFLKGESQEGAERTAFCNCFKIQFITRFGVSTLLKEKCLKCNFQACLDIQFCPFFETN